MKNFVQQKNMSDAMVESRQQACTQCKENQIWADIPVPKPSCVQDKGNELNILHQGKEVNQTNILKLKRDIDALKERAAEIGMILKLTTDNKLAEEYGAQLQKVEAEMAAAQQSLAQ